MKRLALLTAAAFVVVSPKPAEVQAVAEMTALEQLGETLFFDPNLSLNRTQSCASCHDPDQGFADPSGAVSTGADGIAKGRRNAPALGYAALTPERSTDASGHLIGGFFHDGRAATLAEQAAGPVLDPNEMQMPDRAAVVARLNEDAAYRRRFAALYDAGVLTRTDTGFAAMTEALAAFERRSSFSPFDSKFDRALRGEAALTPLEQRGAELFFDPQASNCSACHSSGTQPELFTSYRYFNTGVPENPVAASQDGGLAEVTGEAKHLRRFKTPSLRNVAITGPYMHNGVFEDLETAVRFYNRYQSTESEWQTNPETGASYGKVAVAETLSVGLLIKGPVLSDADIEALIAFLETLTDRRYEHLLKAREQ
ncbi:cytochrome-c peroxidase [Celeribacter neptunius]|uniref:Cytochrome c peroxidase n=1 Tax=Celeribacter neptunius TaxID=588602 RepID=A0A1I3R6A6_9RHOB|nr:cytochrome c peroxidase [Celeribacter neptunius]SFJ41655.1 Cytochrome c peroxidase [Celeribacter neptunius]